MGFGAPAALGAKLASPERTVIALVATAASGRTRRCSPPAFEQDIAVVWVIMNNFAYGTIAGLEKAHFRHDVRHRCSEKNGKPYSPDYAAIAKALRHRRPQGDEGRRVQARARAAIQSGKPFVIDVAMQNEPVPTAGHWNIMDIYSPGKKVHHASTA
jgi:acetolactate synthase-1/2/3 large subunit